MKMSKLLAAVALAGALASGGAANASVVVDTGSSGDFGSNWLVGQGQWVYGYFTATTNTITELGGYFKSNVPNFGTTITASLFADNGGSALLGTVLGSGTFNLDDSGSLQRAGVSGLNISVSVGKGYWVGFTGPYPYGNNDSSGAPKSATNPLVAYGYSNADNPNPLQFYRDDSLDFGVYVVGENSSGAVPEPGTWALMIIGFGSTGAVLRRRQRTVAA